MKALKLKKLQEMKDKELLERFPVEKGIDAPKEVLIIPPMNVTSDVPASPIIQQLPTPLEVAIQRLRDQAQGIA